MAKRKKKKNSKNNQKDFEVIVLIIFSILVTILMLTGSGYIGEGISAFLGGLFGFIKYVIPIGTFALAIIIACNKQGYAINKIIQYTIFLICICVILCIFQVISGNLNLEGEFLNIVKVAYVLGEENYGGGAIGAIMAIPLINLFGIIGAISLCAIIAIVSVIFIIGKKPAELIENIIEKVKEIRSKRYELAHVGDNNDEFRKSKKEKVNKIENQELEESIMINIPKETRKSKNEKKETKKEDNPNREGEEEEIIEANLFKQEIEKKEEKTKEILTLEHAMTIEDEHYEFPPIEFLEKGESIALKGGKKSVTETASKLQKTLYSFGVSAKVEKVSVGPSITRYELKPAEGVRVSKIAKLADDIALNLAAESIRIEAPIPGKQAVGIEVPNKENQVVHLRDIIDSNKFKESPSRLSMALGKDVAGEEVIADIAKMPHVLIAGSTGSGKSVCINTLITSIIYKSKPSEVKLVMIDPKVVELSVYNGIPHLLIPVVTDPKKAAGSLAWAVQEMVNRYSLFARKRRKRY